VGQKSKLLILSEYVNKTEKIEGKIRTSREKMEHSDILGKIFYVTIVLCSNIV